MPNSELSFSKQLSMEEAVFCDSAKDLILSKDFYVLAKRFSIVISREDARYRDFLNKYFYDDGHVDIWKVPHLLLDLHNGDFCNHKHLLDDEGFREKFCSFIGKFYNYCIVEQGILTIKDKYFKEVHKNCMFLRKNQCLYNLIIDTYNRVLDNINEYNKHSCEPDEG